MIPFGPWLPDQPPSSPGSAYDALNVLPSTSGYRPVLTPVPFVVTPGPTVDPLACRTFRSSGGLAYTFMGSTSKLWQVDPAGGIGWIDVTRTVGGDYSTPSQSVWTFSQFDDNVYAHNGLDVTQRFRLDIDAAFSDYANIPISHYGATIRRFLMVAKPVIHAKQLAWCGIGDPSDFVPSAATLSDNQILPDGGDITGLTGGDYGIVFQQHALQRVVFQGPPYAFDFEKISSTLGCNAPRSIAQFGDIVFFLSTSGVKMVRGAQEIVDIGDGKIDDWLSQRIDNSDLWRVTSTIDPRYKLYMLSVPIDDAQTLCDIILAYHWPSGKWTRISLVNYLVCNITVQVGYNLDTVDAIISNNLDLADFSFDSDILNASAELLPAIFDADGNLGYFSGDSMAFTVATGDIQFTQARKTLLRSARPLIEGSVNNLTLTPYVRDQLQNSAVAKAAGSVNRNGICPVRASGRYHRLQVDGALGGSWKWTLGIDDPKFSQMAV